MFQSSIEGTAGTSSSSDRCRLDWTRFESPPRHDVGLGHLISTIVPVPLLNPEGLLGASPHQSFVPFAPILLLRLAQLTLAVSRPYPRANHSQKRLASPTVFAVLRIA
jgi:hypothetical protein